MKKEELYPHYDYKKMMNTYLCNKKVVDFGGEPTKQSERCTGNGKDYQGTIKVTIKGQECVRWSDLIVFNFEDKKNKFSVGSDNFNFCRNPDGKKKPVLIDF